MMKFERQNAEEMRDKLKNILPDLKIAYEDAKLLAEKYDWNMFCFEMCEAYMYLANAYIDVVETLDDDDGGAE